MDEPVSSPVTEYGFDGRVCVRPNHIIRPFGGSSGIFAGIDFPHIRPEDRLVSPVPDDSLGFSDDFIVKDGSGGDHCDSVSFLKKRRDDYSSIHFYSFSGESPCKWNTKGSNNYSLRIAYRNEGAIFAVPIENHY